MMFGQSTPIIGFPIREGIVELSLVRLIRDGEISTERNRVLRQLFLDDRNIEFCHSTMSVGHICAQALLSPSAPYHCY